MSSVPDDSDVQLGPDLRIRRVLNGMWQVSGAHGPIDPAAAVRAMGAYQAQCYGSCHQPQSRGLTRPACAYERSQKQPESAENSQSRHSGDQMSPETRHFLPQSLASQGGVLTPAP